MCPGAAYFGQRKLGRLGLFFHDGLETILETNIQTFKTQVSQNVNGHFLDFQLEIHLRSSSIFPSAMLDYRSV